MDTITLALVILVVALAILVIAGMAWMWHRSRQKSGDLRATFGSEYDRTVERADDRDEAEHELEERRERVESRPIRELDRDEKRRYSEEWRQAQSEFVDHPGDAVQHADTLLVTVMEARGYDVDDDEDRIAADISVGHGDEAEMYRRARDIAARNRRGEASTEDLRQAMQDYKQVFNAVLEPTPTGA